MSVWASGQGFPFWPEGPGNLSTSLTREKSMDKRTFFNEMASMWDQKFNTLQLQEHLKNNLVPRFHLRRGYRVLDVGGGTGGIIPFLLQAIGPQGEVHSIDFAEKMVKVAQSKFARESRVSIQVASVENLPFEDLFFDHVVCFGVFPHIEDRPRALYEINRVLNSSGTLIIAHALSSQEIRAHHKGASPVSEDFLPEEEDMKKLLVDNGFEVESLIDEPKCYCCEAAKKFEARLQKREKSKGKKAN
jgi:ubiquinone/menaquinone biosynthesis C-methylase UbiE